MSLTVPCPSFLKKNWFKPFLLKPPIAFAQCGVKFCSFAFVKQRSVMPRGGWKSAPVLERWVQIVRGPRPKSDKWPKVASRQLLGNPNAVSQPLEIPPNNNQFGKSPSRPPDRVSAEATEEVHRLEAVVRVGRRKSTCEARSKAKVLSSRAILAQAISLEHCIVRACGESLLFYFCSQVRRGSHAAQGMDRIPNAIWLVRCDSWSSPEVRGVAASSAVAVLETRLVASSFRSVLAASSGGSAAQPPGPTRTICVSSGTKSDREVTERVGGSGRRGLQAALKGAERSAKECPFAIQVEECQACIKRSQMSARTAGAGRRDGSHGQVA